MSLRPLCPCLALCALSSAALAQEAGSPWGEAPEPAPAAEEGAPAAEEAGEEAGEAEEEAAEEAVHGSRQAAEGEEAAEGAVHASRPAAPALELAEPGAAVARIELRAEPSSSPPGGEVVLTVVFWTEDDQAVPEVAFDLLSKEGELGEVVEEGGRSTATLTLSAYAEGQARVSVITEDGLHEVLAIPIAGEPVSPAPAPSAAEAAPSRPTRTPGPATDPMWLRAAVRGAGGLYAYAQTPDPDDSGPLIGQTLAFGGQEGPGARAIGGELSATWWSEDLPQVGAQGELRVLGYAVESGAFEGVAPDYLYDGGLYAVGRVPVQAGRARLWAGGRLGLHYSDFMLFEGCLDPGCTVSFTTAAMPGLGLGPRGGLELDRVYAELGYTLALGRFTEPYAHTLDAMAGWIVSGPVAVELAFDQVIRSIALQSDRTGELRGAVRDSQTVGGLGVALVF